MTMPRVDALHKAIKAGDARLVAELVAGLADEERRRAAQELPGLLSDLREADQSWMWRASATKSALLVAGAGCVSGPAAAAQWLGRADLRPRDAFGFDVRGHVALVVQATGDRPAGWRAEVGRRLAGRLRVTDQMGWGGDEAAWWTCALLLRSAGAPPPADDAFAVGFVRWTSPADLADHPFTDALIQRIFEVEAIGREIVRFAEGRHWRDALIARVERGELGREALLDGCLRRFLRGGAQGDLRWYAALHDRLAPDLGEATARLRDYLRLLPTAPVPVAEIALREVRRVDDAGGLDGAAYAEAAAALMFRPERKLVRAALPWLAESAGRGGDGARVDSVLSALAVAFGHEAAAVRERAVGIAVKHGAEAGERVRREVRDAAAALPHDLRERIAAVFGEVEAPAAEPAALPLMPPPAAFPGPIGSAAELAEEIAALLRAEPSWTDVERFTAGIVDLAHRDAEAARTALKGILQDGRTAWYMADDFDRFVYSPHAWPVLVARSFLVPKWRPEPTSPLRFDGHRTPRPYDPPMGLLLIRRMREIAAMVGRTPLLLATSTSTNGHLDPEELVARVERLEAAGLEPGPLDLAQALLRLPRDAALSGRARRLGSPAGKALVSWLEAGGLPDPVVELAVARLPEDPGLPPAALMGLVRPSGDVPDDLAPLSHHPGDNPFWRRTPEKYFSLGHFFSPVRWWPAMAPSHTELVAAHMLPRLAPALEFPSEQGAALLGLAESDGPTGVATGAALAYGLGVEPVRERAGAVDALLHMAARGRLPAAEVGTAAGTLAGHRAIKLNRVVAALGEAAAGGAQAAVWTAVEAALPAALAAHADKPVPGMADLLALGVRTAEVAGARGRVPDELAAAAGRGGSSRTVKEAVRLRDLLTRG
ncbi:hypothetical protein GCM10010191_28420 [Actinomadura vinacea]|uniref:Secreted protein n=1 Tax=Actinomadura vinacea TaxID=115336 RepID=A0ABN3IZ66_9ACTN